VVYLHPQRAKLIEAELAVEHRGGQMWIEGVRIAKDRGVELRSTGSTSDVTNFEIYRTLFAQVEQIGPKKEGARRAIYVHEKRAEDCVSSFNPKWNNRPALQIHNPDQTSPTIKPVDDARLVIKLVSLAHEMGHATSWATNADSAWDAYFAAINHRYEVQMRAIGSLGGDASLEERTRAAIAAVRTELSDEERQLIWQEENRAWGIAEKLLRAIPFDEWDAFHKRREAALRSHEVRLGLTEPGAGELALLPSDFE